MQLTTKDIWRIFAATITTMVISLLLIVPSGAQSSDLPKYPKIIAAEAQVAQLESDVRDVVAFIISEQQRQIAEYVAAVQEGERAAAVQAYLASQQQARAPQARSTPVGSTVGECSGFAIPDYIIQRESGGNPSAYNPSGAYGCAQTLLSHYSGGSCSGLDPYSIEGQRECVNRLSNGGTNLAPWAETR